MIFTPIFETSPIFEMILVALCGLVFGSFASALTYRVPRGLPWASRGKNEENSHGLRSACTSCKTLLSFKDLIPVLSWLTSKGKCRHCGEQVSIVYPICEFLTLMGCMGVYLVYGLTWFTIPFFLLIPFLVALMMIDFEHMILPNQLVTISFALGGVVLLLRMLNTVVLTDMALEYLSGAVVFALFAWALSVVMKKLLKRDALGMGDIKFFAVGGVWLGLSSLGNFCIGAGVVGTLLGLIWQKITGKSVFPFGPALILAFYALLLFQGTHFMGKTIN